MKKRKETNLQEVEMLGKTGVVTADVLGGIVVKFLRVGGNVIKTVDIGSIVDVGSIVVVGGAGEVVVRAGVTGGVDAAVGTWIVADDIIFASIYISFYVFIYTFY